MATIIIDPIATYSKGSYSVTITGIDPTEHDCIKGTIVTPGAGIQQGEWNLAGTMRGGKDNSNLDPRDEVTSNVIATAISLGSKY